MSVLRFSKLNVYAAKRCRSSESYGIVLAHSIRHSQTEKEKRHSRMTRLCRYFRDYEIPKLHPLYGEDFYHAFLSGIFAGAGYRVDSNKEHGEGRSDVVVCDTINGRVAIFEAKRAMTLGDLESACDKALRQIDQRMYAKDFEDEYDSDHIHCYGIAFYKKRCFVKKKG